MRQHPELFRQKKGCKGSTMGKPWGRFIVPSTRGIYVARVDCWQHKPDEIEVTMLTATMLNAHRFPTMAELVSVKRLFWEEKDTLWMKVDEDPNNTTVVLRCVKD